MKLKKWGALLLALCMIVMMFPTTVMANGDSLAGPDAEKKVIENDLIVYDTTLVMVHGDEEWNEDNEEQIRLSVTLEEQ